MASSITCDLCNNVIVGTCFHFIVKKLEEGAKRSNSDNTKMLDVCEKCATVPGEKTIIQQAYENRKS